MIKISPIVVTATIITFSAATLGGVQPAQAATPIEHDARASKSQEFIKYAESQGLSTQDAQSMLNSYFTVADISSSTPLAEPNGCSNPVPGFGKVNEIFKPACDNHDRCYSSDENKGRSRKQCDDEFLRGMKDICTSRYDYTDIEQKRCKGTAGIYHKMVRLFGEKHYRGSGDPS